MNIFDNIRYTFKQGNSLIQLIYINVAVYVLINLILIIMLLFNQSGSFILSYLAVPSDLKSLLYHAWTPLTYMVLHESFLHILFNMLALFWFGKIFLLYFSEKQLIGLYLFGGFLASFFFVTAFNSFPYYTPYLRQSILLGASGSIMAIIVASAVQSPNLEMQLLFIGGIKLKYIAIVAVLTSFFGITSDNGGGQLAHLGGSLAGYLFVVSLRQGKDLTSGLNRIMDSIHNLFGPRKLKVKHSATRKNAPMSDAEFNMNKARKMAEIDKILDKIKTSGYRSEEHTSELQSR